MSVKELLNQLAEIAAQNQTIISRIVVLEAAEEAASDTVAWIASNSSLSVAVVRCGHKSADAALRVWRRRNEVGRLVVHLQCVRHRHQRQQDKFDGASLFRLSKTSP